MIDGRTGTEANAIEEAHQGTKSVKIAYLGIKDKLTTLGFTRQAGRQIKIWDPRNLAAHLKVIDVDTGSGVLMPFYDTDTHLLYLAGKGDGNIRYYEIVDEAPFCVPINEYRTTTPAKGMCMVPKRGCDVLRCETTRLLKLTNNSVEPLSFIVPRKSDAFQEDLFPPAYSGEPSHTADEWLGGSDLAPKTRSLNPNSSGEEEKAPQTVFAPVKSIKQLQVEAEELTAAAAEKQAQAERELTVCKEAQAELEAQLEASKKQLEEATARILELEKRLREAGLDAS